MNILITGLHGFVGSNLIITLSKDHKLYGIDIIKPNCEGVIATYKWQALEKDHLPPVDVIIHLAGKAHDTKNYTQAGEYFEINTGLTTRIFDYFMRSGASKFIFFSSVKAVADHVDGILTEDVIPHPIGPYAESKLKAEQYIIDHFPELAVSYQLPVLSNEVVEASAISNEHSAFSTQHSAFSTQHSEQKSGNQELRTKNQEPGLANAEPRTQNPEQKSVYILRPCMIHGPGNKGNLNLLYKVVKKGIPWPLGAFNNRRSFTSIDNLNFVIEQLIEKDIPSGIYNMADDEAVSTNELIGIIHQAISSQLSAVSFEPGIENQETSEPESDVHDQRTTDAELRTQNPELRTKKLIWNIPKPVIRAIASLGSLLHLPLNKDRMQKLTENYVVSNAKIKAALGIESMPVKAGEGLRRTVRSFNK